MDLKLRRKRPVTEWKAVERIDADPSTSVYESECVDSELMDRVTAYVSRSSRTVLLMVDYSPFLDVREIHDIKGGRSIVQGQRPGSLADFLALLESYGLKEAAE